MRLLSSLILLCVAVTTTGCVAAAGGAAGAAGLAYATGKIDRTYPYPLDVVWEASDSALTELELTPGQKAKDQLKGHMEYYTATGDHVKLKFISIGDSTKVALRVNTFGNKAMSQAVLQKLEGYLPREVANRASIRPATYEIQSLSDDDQLEPPFDDLDGPSFDSGQPIQ